MSEHKPREHNRYNIRTVARIRKAGGDWAEVRVETLSSMGANFQCNLPLKEGDSIEFFMPAPSQDARPYHLNARIVWIKDGRVGIEFTGTAG